jgi:hypothetical protein|tara:strand:- start:156 stop:275 length:120 start_codon:yes stop_codon:yes gene_type:complete
MTAIDYKHARLNYPANGTCANGKKSDEVNLKDKDVLQCN